MELSQKNKTKFYISFICRTLYSKVTQINTKTQRYREEIWDSQRVWKFEGESNGSKKWTISFSMETNFGSEHETMFTDIKI